VVEEFAPWLDATCPDPAEPGELRWYTVLDDALQWFRTGEEVVHKGERVRPRSRTFIPGRVDDNPVLLRTGYKATLQALPEPLRSQMLYGDFSAGVEDDAWQVIPTDWVRAAQARWTPERPAGQPLSCLGVDVARGGQCQTVVAPRYGAWFGPPRKHPGRLTSDGPRVAALVVAEHADGATINVDVIGVGASAYDCLKGQDGLRRLVNPVNNAESCERRDRTRKYRLVNVRAASWWSLREALDPEHGDDLALPRDPELLADLTAPRYQVTAAGIKVEPKEDVVERIGRSPDCGDAVVLAHWQGGPWRHLTAGKIG
jgi:hypothetical protein